jgi:hypothetical protein
MHLALRTTALVVAAASAGMSTAPQDSPVPKTEIQGVVLRPDGKPARRARVGFIAAPTLGQTGQNTQGPIVVTADEQGSFRFETNGINEFSVRAHLAPFATTSQLRVGAGQRVTLKLETGVTLAGEVTAASSAEPLQSAVIEASEWDVSPDAEVDPDFAMARTKTDAKGRFVLKGVPGGGRQMVRVHARSFCPGASTFPMPSSFPSISNSEPREREAG